MQPSKEQKASILFVLVLILLFAVFFIAGLSGCDSPTENDCKNVQPINNDTVVISYKLNGIDTSAVFNSDKQIIQGGYLNLYNNGLFLFNVPTDSITNFEN